MLANMFLDMLTIFGIFILGILILIAGLILFVLVGGIIHAVCEGLKNNNSEDDRHGK